MRTLNTISSSQIDKFLQRYQLKLSMVACDTLIPYSFWGTPEAGRSNTILFARDDTPLHSLLHEAAHYVCLTEQQRLTDKVDAGGTAIIENACCYLQILWSDYLEGFNRYIHLNDMDSWGYNFRLGSASRWFFADSDDAKEWLIKNNIINEHSEPTWEMRL